MIRTKVVYRDTRSGRLIPKKVAQERPPMSWREETIHLADIADGPQPEGFFDPEATHEEQAP